MPSNHKFYDQLARWWPLISPVGDYAEEAAEFLRVLSEARPDAKAVLELGSGGGHNAFYMKSRFHMTLSDLAEPMLEVSRRLNPECEHVAADMRTIDLGRTFDAVFIHDAIDYMTTEPDLGAAMASAWRHCRPGGVALFVPDHFQETFAPDTDCGGSDGPDGEGVRFLEWSYDPDPTDNTGVVQYTFLTREAGGAVASYTEAHTFGLFPRSTWIELLRRQGFEPEEITERTEEDREPRTFLLGHRPAG